MLRVAALIRQRHLLSSVTKRVFGSCCVIHDDKNNLREGVKGALGIQYRISHKPTPYIARHQPYEPGEQSPFLASYWINKRDVPQSCFAMDILLRGPSVLDHNGVTWIHFLELLFEKHHYGLVLKYASILSEKLTEPSQVYTFNKILSQYMEKRWLHYDVIEELFDVIPHPNIKSYHLLIQCYVRNVVNLF